MDISPAFQANLQDKGINFLKQGVLKPEESFLMVHYGEGRRGVSIVKFIPINAPEETGSPWLNHVAIAGRGSSGAPLIASDSTNGFVVAMNCGQYISTSVNCAVKIKNVLEHIGAQTGQLEPPNVGLASQGAGMQ